MSKDKDTSKLWGGRFSEATDAFVQRFTASVDFDQRMAAEDIAGSLAHARMLASIGVLNDKELGEIEAGLEQVSQEIESGNFQWSEQMDMYDYTNIVNLITECVEKGILDKMPLMSKDQVED